jgi:hypothetical protein
MKTTKYKFYLSEVISKVAKTIGTDNSEKRRIKASYSLEQVLLKIIQTSDTEDHTNMLTTIQGLFFIGEYNWKSHSERVVINPESTKVVEGIMKCKFNISSIKALEPEAQSFILNFPKNYELTRNMKAVSCIVTITDQTKALETYYAPFMKSIGLDKKITLGENKSCVDSNMIISIGYRVHDKELGRLVEYATTLPWDYVGKMLLSDQQVKTPIFDNYTATGLNHEETEYQKSLLKFVVNMLIYTKVSRDTLIEGVPHKAINMKRFKVGHQKNMLLSIPKQQRGKQADPSWHIRQLVHHKYYQKSFAEMKPGSRLIFVFRDGETLDVSPKVLMERDRNI